MTGRRTGQSLEEEGRALVERNGGRWTGEGGLCRCPAHDDKRPSLSVRIGRSRILLHCFAGCHTADILRRLRSAGMPLDDRSPPETTRKGSALGEPSAAAIRLWGRARPIGGTPAEQYLRARFIDTDTGELRYHPRTPHGPKPRTHFRPALIAAIRDQLGLVAIHRSFLDPQTNRLASLDEARCGLGRFGGGAVRLGGIASRLGLAEGIETALSASILFKIPCWATLGTERFRHVVLPEEVRTLVLFLDNDRGGRRAEALAREAFRHLAIELFYPRQDGADWNDVLRGAPRRRNDMDGEALGQVHHQSP